MGQRRRRQLPAPPPGEPAPSPEAQVAPSPLLWLAPLVLVAAVLLAYASVLDADFVNYDDQAYVTENRWITGGLQARSVVWATTAFEAGNWHPLTWISHMADCQAFGIRPRGHHAVNLALHALSSVLVFLVMRRLTGQEGPSAVVAGLFALHPLNVESVAWVSERKNVLSTVFWLLAMGAYAGYARRPSMGRYLLVMLCLALGLLAKPMVVTLPCVLLLLDVWPLRRVVLGAPGSLARLGRLAVEKIPLLALSLLSSALTVGAQSAGGAVTSLEAIPLPARVSNALVAYLAYLGKTLWPAGLAAFYPHVAMSLVAPRVLFSALALALVTAFVVRQAATRPWLLVGWLWYLGTLVPVIGLVQVGSQAMADRYAYVPLLGIFVMAAFTAEELLGSRGRGILAAAALAWLAVLGLLTARQARFWHDSRTLFGHALAVTEKNYVAETNIGLVDAKEEQWAAAIARFHSALSIRPGHAEARANLGVALAKMGKVDEAIPQLEKALRLDPNSSLTHANLGLALRSKDMPRALEHMRRAVELKPDFMEARLNLGAALLDAGKGDEAQGAFEAALAIDSTSAAAHFRLGSILLDHGRPREAAARFEQALVLDPKLASARNSLGVARLREGRADQAIPLFQDSLREGPGNADVEANLGTALLRVGREAEAETHLRAALALKPDNSAAHTSLGALLARRGNLAEALPHFSAAVEADPSQAEAQNNLGAAMLQLGKTDEALVHLRKAVERNPLHADAQANLAVALLLKGDRAGAVSHLEEALRIEPGHKNARAQLDALSGQRSPS
jgi:tetratricopeptide (TPR) repeat protein